MNSKSGPKVEPTQASGKELDATRIAKYTDLMTTSAQANGGEHISFSSFLAIGRSQASSPSGPLAQEAGSPPPRAEPEVILAEAENQRSGPLERAAVDEGASRARPIKDRGTRWGNKKQAAEAVNSLLGLPRSASKNSSKKLPGTESSETVRNALIEGSERSAGTHRQASHSSVSRSV